MDKVWNDDHIQRAGLPVCLGGAMSGVHWEAQSKHKGTCLEINYETMIFFLILPKQLTDSSLIFYSLPMVTSLNLG